MQTFIKQAVTLIGRYYLGTGISNSHEAVEAAYLAFAGRTSVSLYNY